MLSGIICSQFQSDNLNTVEEKQQTNFYQQTNAILKYKTRGKFESRINAGFLYFSPIFFNTNECFLAQCNGPVIVSYTHRRTQTVFYLFINI